MLKSLQELISEYDMKIDGVLHLGAHVGEEAEAYDAAGIGNVLWVEANPDLIPELEQNISRYGHKYVNACVDSISGIGTMLHVTNNVMSSSLLPLGTHKKRAPQVKYTHDIAMVTHTVDDICRQNNFHNFNFLNADLQGLELRAFSGAVGELRHVEWIFTEINFDELYIDCARAWQLDEFLWEQGFYRVETWMAQGNVGWGDCLYVRRDYVR
jgi:FkbM family methyltransferase